MIRKLTPTQDDAVMRGDGRAVHVEGTLCAALADGCATRFRAALRQCCPVLVLPPVSTARDCKAIRDAGHHPVTWVFSQEAVCKCPLHRILLNGAAYSADDPVGPHPRRGAAGTTALLPAWLSSLKIASNATAAGRPWQATHLPMYVPAAAAPAPRRAAWRRLHLC